MSAATDLAFGAFWANTSDATSTLYMGQSSSSGTFAYWFSDLDFLWAVGNAPKDDVVTARRKEGFKHKLVKPPTKPKRPVTVVPFHGSWMGRRNQ